MHIATPFSPNNELTSSFNCKGPAKEVLGFNRISSKTSNTGHDSKSQEDEEDED